MQDAAFSAFVQIAVVFLIAFLVYVAFGRKTGSFTNYIGLQPTSGTAALLAAGSAILFAAVALLTPDLRALSTGEGSVVRQNDAG